jgi:hypothetical protein
MIDDEEEISLSDRTDSSQSTTDDLRSIYSMDLISFFLIAKFSKETYHRDIFYIPSFSEHTDGDDDFYLSSFFPEENIFGGESFFSFPRQEKCFFIFYLILFRVDKEEFIGLISETRTSQCLIDLECIFLRECDDEHEWRPERIAFMVSGDTFFLIVEVGFCYLELLATSIFYSDEFHSSAIFELGFDLLPGHLIGI